MVFTRSPKLRPDIETQLKEEMKPLWKSGLTAKQIAYRLGFGEPRFRIDRDFVPDPRYEKLRTYHVWFYRQKFGFQHRRKSAQGGKGKSRYKVKHKEVMSFVEFQMTLNEKVAKIDEPYCQRMRAFLILLYWTPLRNTEIIERVRRDFTIKDGMLKIDLYRKKKYYRPNAEPEPFFLRTTYPMVDEVISWVDRFDKNERPFDFKRWTAWNYVRQVFPTYYPHFFRFNYITRGVNNAEEPGSLIRALLEDTGLDIATVSEYVMADSRFRNSLNDRELELINMKR